jgi:hypothetical protein
MSNNQKNGSNQNMSNARSQTTNKKNGSNKAENTTQNRKDANDCR